MLNAPNNVKICLKNVKTFQGISVTLSSWL